MINKRLLIQNIISHNDENTFFDKKSLLEIDSDSSKAKLLKHICAFSNSNPENESYLIIGVSNNTDELIGIDFIDDSKIQHLVKSYLTNAPIISYENISFSELPKYKSIGLLTIAPTKKTTSFSKTIWKMKKENAYYRYGSNSIVIDENFYIDNRNLRTIDSIHKNSSNNLKSILDGVDEFKSTWGKEYKPEHLVFKDQFVLCWAGYRDSYGSQKYLSEVDIQIINENKRLFFSATQFINIEYDTNKFNITEFTPLGFDDKYKLYPIEKTELFFNENGTYKISTINIFTPPKFSKLDIKKLYNRSKKAEKECRSNQIKKEEFSFIEGIANYYLICYFNGIKEAKYDLINSKEYLDGSAAEWQSDCMRILTEYEKT